MCNYTKEFNSKTWKQCLQVDITMLNVDQRAGWTMHSLQIAWAGSTFAAKRDYIMCAHGLVASWSQHYADSRHAGCPFPSPIIKLNPNPRVMIWPLTFCTRDQCMMRLYLQRLWRRQLKPFSFQSMHRQTKPQKQLNAQYHAIRYKAMDTYKFNQSTSTKIQTNWNWPRSLLSRAISRSPWCTLISTCVWPSAAVENT